MEKWVKLHLITIGGKRRGEGKIKMYIRIFNENSLDSWKKGINNTFLYKFHFFFYLILIVLQILQYQQ